MNPSSPLRRAATRAVVALLSLAAPAGVRAATVADAESSWAAGRLEQAERGFVAFASTNDTLVALRRAGLRMLHDDTRGARAIAEPLLARRPEMRSIRSLLLEAHVRERDFAGAAPLARALGREARARQLESFGTAPPYRLEGPGHVEVPFVATDPLPVIEVRLDGHGPYFMLIDTGGAELVVDPVFADSLGLARFGSETGTFGGGKKRDVELSHVGSLTLGGATLHDLPAGLLDCSRFAGAAGGRRIAGIVGTRVLMQFRASLDYPGHRLVLDARGAGPLPRDSTRIVVPMWIGGDHYLLARGGMNDAPDALWFVDSGLAGAAITAPAATLVESGIAVPDTSDAAGTGQGGGGSVKVKFFPVERFRLGGASAKGLAGFFGPFPPTLERAFGYRIAGIISHGFLRAWRVTLDFDAMELVFERPA